MCRWNPIQYVHLTGREWDTVRAMLFPDWMVLISWPIDIACDHQSMSERVMFYRQSCVKTKENRHHRRRPRCRRRQRTNRLLCSLQSPKFDPPISVLIQQQQQQQRAIMILMILIILMMNTTSLCRDKPCFASCRRTRRYLSQVKHQRQRQHQQQQQSIGDTWSVSL